MPQASWENLFFGDGMYIHALVKENVRIPFVLFCIWILFTLLLPQVCLASPRLALPCLALSCLALTYLASFQPPSWDHKKQDQTMSWPICLHYHQEGTRCFAAAPLSQCVHHRLAHLPLSPFRVGKILGSSPLHNCSKWENIQHRCIHAHTRLQCEEQMHSRAFPCNGGSWKADIPLPWVSTHRSLVGRDSTLSWISWQTWCEHLSHLCLSFFLIHWPPK